MFYQVQYFTNANDRQLIDSHLVEVPSRERAADFVRHQHEHTGADVLMQRIHTTDDSIAPPGWTYETRQIWVEGLDTGWCRKWVKQVVTAEMPSADECQCYDGEGYPLDQCSECPR